MRRLRLLASMAALAIAATAIASPVAAKGPPVPGGEDAYGNNLSVPATFLGDTTGAPALRIACGTYAVPGADGVPASTTYPGYWLQKTEATWSADCGTATAANVIADWGDNLTGTAAKAGTPIRVEVALLDPTIGLRGFVVTNLTPTLEDRLSTYGTNPTSAFITGATGAPSARVWDQGATLSIVNVDTQATIFNGPMAAEINSIGAVTYGYNWGTKGKRTAPQPGTYDITFRTVRATITGIADTGATTVPTFTSNSTTLRITLTTSGTINPGRGGGGGGGTR